MDDTTAPRRRPVTSFGGKAPAYVKGIQPLDVSKQLAQASDAQIAQLYSDSFALWSQLSGIEVDNRPFDFSEHRYLLDIYLCESKDLAWMKSAQMGATIYEVLRLLWFCRYHTLKAGLYFPTADGVNTLSKDRLGPVIRSIPELAHAVKSVDGKESQSLKQIENVHGKLSSLYMLYLGGTASKDSVPLDVLGFDEVRLCSQDDIDQAIERVSHSTFKHKMYVSTAGYPNLDIHRRFEFGTQQYWHVKCNCTDGFVPSECFPECIVDTGKEVYLRCPKCKYRIHDAQNGRYIAHNPGGDYPSFHISQFISRFITPKEIWNHYNRATNKKEFYNAKLGKPFVDQENIPITDDVLQNCVNPDLHWLIKSGNRKDKKNCSMGIDQHGGNIYVVILRRGPNGKKHLVHIEIVDQNNPQYFDEGQVVSPFKRAYHLMREFDVGMCLVDAMPNYNEATDFARAFPGRVFTAWYGDLNRSDIVQWSDRPGQKQSVKRGSAKIKLKWQAILNRYASIDTVLSELVDRNIEMPHPDALVQVVRSKEGRYEAENVCRTQFWLHMKSIVRQKTILDDVTGRFKMEWAYLGIDPHFVHAFNYANIALERLKRQAIFII